MMNREFAAKGRRRSALKLKFGSTPALATFTCKPPASFELSLGASGKEQSLSEGVRILMRAIEASAAGSRDEDFQDL